MNNEYESRQKEGFRRESGSGDFSNNPMKLAQEKFLNLAKSVKVQTRDENVRNLLNDNKEALDIMMDKKYPLGNIVKQFNEIFAEHAKVKINVKDLKKCYNVIEETRKPRKKKPKA